MAKKKMKAQTSARQISPKELKFWLEGILEFQDENWIPNREQWKNIQEKIFNLQEIYEVAHIAPSSQKTSQIENVFAPNNGGVAGQPASTFPENAGENQTFPSSLPISPQGPMPVRDANGFLKMPNEIGNSENLMVPSGTKVHKLKNNGFD